MTEKQKIKSTEESKLHPRNIHSNGYDFDRLIEAHPKLDRYVNENKYGNRTINFFDPKAVLTLNRALLKALYGINFWKLPKNALCPPIPGRADYIHYVADLLTKSNGGNISHLKNIKALDVGTGSSCIYPLLGHQIYGWSFVGTDIDKSSIGSAQNIINENGFEKISLRHQADSKSVFSGVVNDDDLFDVVLCNPPFYSSAKEAEAATHRKVSNLKKKTTKRVIPNFKGKSNELWCDGGEKKFLSNMIEESSRYSTRVFWFTALVSRKEHLDTLYYVLKKYNVESYETIEMTQGNKVSRFIAWTFMNKKKQKIWAEARWR